jgi:hypothetical protein
MMYLAHITYKRSFNKSTWIIPLLSETKRNEAESDVGRNYWSLRKPNCTARNRSNG